MTNDASNTVSVINTFTNKVTATVNVGNYPVGVVVTPNGKKAYVVNADSNTVSIIDTATNKVTATVGVGSYPLGVAISPDGKKVYVADETSPAISVIDTTTDTVTDVPISYQPFGVAVNPSGTKVYATSFVSNIVCVIDTTTNAVISIIPVGNSPRGVAVTPNGKKLYVANNGDSTVSVIDTVSNTVTATVSVGNSPRGVAVTPDGKKVYIANTGSSSISVIDTGTNKVIATVSVGNGPIAMGQFIGSVSTPVANFTSNVTSGYVPLTVQFTDLSKNAAGWKWNFGDGTNSTQQNPTHVFKAIGNYTVALTAMNAAGNDTTTKTNYIKITVAPQLPVAAFSATPTSGTAPLNVNFTDTSIGTPTKWKWNFGDLKTSKVQSPSHIYKKAGTYTVSLTIKNAYGINTTTKANFIVVNK